jgi:metallo-beta-lactamase class B
MTPSRGPGRRRAPWRSIVFTTEILFGLATLAAGYTPAQPEWNRPVPPFRIAGNLYYVGAKEVASYLITTPAGHLLLDSGFAETVPQVERNLKALGFDPKDVRVLLNSHAHYDHAGGLAALKRLTGAKLYASTADAPQLERGGLDDFAFGDRFPFEPVTVDRRLADGEVVELGGTRLKALVTPGHTRGCTTWTTPVREGDAAWNVVFLCSLTAPGYRLVGNPAYPRLLDDYRASIARVRALPCDIFLAPHGSFFDLEGKRARLGKGPNPFVDPGALRRHADEQAAALETELQRQSKAAPIEGPSRPPGRP